MSLGNGCDFCLEEEHRIWTLKVGRALWTKETMRIKTLTVKWTSYTWREAKDVMCLKWEYRKKVVSSRKASVMCQALGIDSYAIGNCSISMSQGLMNASYYSLLCSDDIILSNVFRLQKKHKTLNLIYFVMKHVRKKNSWQHSYSDIDFNVLPSPWWLLFPAFINR